jgi:trypsin
LRLRTLLVTASAVLATAGSITPANAIINGSAAAEGAYPFMAAITDPSGFAYCGGTVIAASWVLTAAHCVVDETASNVRVVTGRTNLSNTGQGQVIAVSQIVVEPKYDGSAWDAALLHLASPTTSAPIRLAAASDDYLEAAGTTVRVTGWGDQTPTLGLLATDQLREVDLQVVSDSECATTNFGLNAATSVCAAALLKDSCNGDSGGPLFSTTAPIRTQIGIVSYGTSCALPEFPGVYSEVNNAHIRNWITTTSGV